MLIHGFIIYKKIQTLNISPYICQVILIKLKPLSFIISNLLSLVFQFNKELKD